MIRWPCRLERVPDPLAVSFADGRPIVIAARNSGEHGSAPRRAAIQDLLGAAESLATYGVDISDALPSQVELDSLLRSAAPQVSKTANGQEFSNRFVTIDLRASHGVMVLLSVGTGRKLDEAASQPFVRHLAEMVRRTHASLLFARRVDRFTRVAWALGPVMLQLDASDGYIGDAVHGVRTVSGVDSLMVFFTAQTAETEADKLPMQTRQGMRARTSTSLSSGSCSYGVAHPPPPGLFTYRSRDGGVIGARILTFDTPSCHPDPDRIAAGVPEVYHADRDGITRPVDQVANVRWVLAQLGDPRWSSKQLAVGLVNRGFSTEGLRRTHGQCAKYTIDIATSAPYRILQPILANLDYYETGRLERTLGVDGVDPVVIHDGFPPDGKWATDEDFDRIRTWRAATPPPAHRTLSLSGLPATVNDVEAVLIARAGADRPRLTAVRRDAYRDDGRQRSTGVPVVIDAATVLDTFVDALAAAGDAVLTLVPTDDSDDNPFLHELHAARTERAVVDDERQALLRQIEARAADGAPLVSGALLRDLNERYNDLADRLPIADQLIEHLEQRQLEHQRAIAAERSSVTTQRLLHLVASLRDPTDLTYRDLLRRTIQDLTITTTQHRQARRSWSTHVISFAVVISDHHGVVRIPANTVVTVGVVCDLNAIADDTLIQLTRSPATLAAIDPPERYKVTQLLAERFGLTGRTLMLPNVTDPRLAHLAANVLATPDRLDEIAAHTGEPPALLQRILHLHRTATRAVWFGRNRTVLANWYELGARGPVTPQQVATRTNTAPETARNLLYESSWRDNWTNTADGYTLSPCPHCGSRRRNLARIPEPDGLVCLQCHLDSAGFAWPLDTYRRYLITDT